MLPIVLARFLLFIFLLRSFLHVQRLHNNFLSSLQLPVTIKSAYIHSLRIQFLAPWSSILAASASSGLPTSSSSSAALLSQGISIEIDGIYLLITITDSIPAEDNLASDLDALNHTIEQSLRQYTKIESSSTGTNLSSSSSASSAVVSASRTLENEIQQLNNQTTGKGAFYNILSFLIDNVNISVKNIHIRLEQCSVVSSSSSFFSIGIIFQSLVLRSSHDTTDQSVVNDKNTASTDTMHTKEYEMALLNKRLTLQGLTIYIDSGSRFVVDTITKHKFSIEM